MIKKINDVGFAKARQQYLCSANAKIKKGHKKIYIEITDIDNGKPHIVTCEQTPNGKVFNCDCMSKTFHIDKPTLCTHIMTAIMELIRRAK